MTAQMPRMPWFPRDFASSTRGWPLVARGLYRELLDAQWDLGGLPPEDKTLRKLADISLKEWRVSWRFVEQKFPICTDGMRRNQRLEVHRLKDLERIEKRRKAAISRWEAERAADANAQAQGMQMHDVSASVLHMPPTPTPTPIKKVERSMSVRPLARTSEIQSAEFHQEVIGLYHELLPELPKVKLWTEKRRRALAARIREQVKRGKPADQSDYWRRFFEHVAGSDFLCGRNGKDFRATLEWLVKSENFVKVIEGNYVNGRQGVRG